MAFLGQYILRSLVRLGKAACGSKLISISIWTISLCPPVFASNTRSANKAQLIACTKRSSYEPSCRKVWAPRQCRGRQTLEESRFFGLAARRAIRKRVCMCSGKFGFMRTPHMSQLNQKNPWPLSACQPKDTAPKHQQNARWVQMAQQHGRNPSK